MCRSWIENPNTQTIGLQIRLNGLYDAFEGVGLSAKGGNSQVTDKKKQFVILPSVEAGMVYKAEYIKKYNGNYARWYSMNTESQKRYRDSLKDIKPRIVNNFLTLKS